MAHIIESALDKPTVEEGLLYVSPKLCHLPTRRQEVNVTRMKVDDECEEVALSYRAVSDVADDAGDEGCTSGLCCYGTRVLSREVNRLRREGGR